MRLPPEEGDFGRYLSPVHLSATRGLGRIPQLGNAIALGVALSQEIYNLGIPTRKLCAFALPFLLSQ